MAGSRSHSGVVTPKGVDCRTVDDPEAALGVGSLVVGIVGVGSPVEGRMRYSSSETTVWDDRTVAVPLKIRGELHNRGVPL